MNSLSFSPSLWNNYLSVNSPFFYFPSRGFTEDSYWFSRIHFESTIFSANSLKILNILSKLTMNWLSLLRIHCTDTIFLLKALWIYYKITNSSRILYDLTMNSLSVCKFTVIWEWIYYLFRKFNMNFIFFTNAL